MTTDQYKAPSFVITAGLTSETADPDDYSHLLDFVLEHADTGEPYTFADLRNDKIGELGNLQMSPDELEAEAGKVAVLWEDSLKGERIRVIKYNQGAVDMVASVHRPQAPQTTAVLSIEKKSSQSLFRVDFNLSSASSSFEGLCWLANPRLRVRSGAMHQFAARWGLEAVWQSYWGSGEVGTKIPFNHKATKPIVAHTLDTLAGMI